MPGNIPEDVANFANPADLVNQGAAVPPPNQGHELIHGVPADLVNQVHDFIHGPPGISTYLIICILPPIIYILSPYLLPNNIYLIRTATCC